MSGKRKNDETEETGTTANISYVIAGCFGLTIYFVGYLTLLIIFRGFAFYQLWLWYVAPHFELSPLSLPLAMGLMLIPSLFIRSHDTSKNKNEDDNEDDDVLFKIAKPFLPILFVIVAGYLIQLFL